MSDFTKKIFVQKHKELYKGPNSFFYQLTHRKILQTKYLMGFFLHIHADIQTSELQKVGVGRRFRKSSIILNKPAFVY